MSDAGRHWVTLTTPGSSSSRPSKKPATTSLVRPTWLASARCWFIRLIISAIASGEMSLAACEIVTKLPDGMALTSRAMIRRAWSRSGM
jgi:hypothetical protein